MSYEEKWKELVNDLTCSICHELLNCPKILTQCPHAYCFACLEVTVSSESTITCPQCGLVSLVEKDGIQALQTDNIAQILVDYVRCQFSEKSQSESSSHLLCPHFTVPGEEVSCRHCGEVMCGSCKTEHLSQLKTFLLEMSKPILDDISVMSLLAKKAQLQCSMTEYSFDLVGKVKAATEATLTTIQDLLGSRKRAAIGAISLKTEQVMKQFGDIFEQLTDTVEVESMKRRRLTLSDGDDLDEVASFFQKLSGRYKMLVKMFDELGASAFISNDPATKIIETLINFERDAVKSLTVLSGDETNSAFSNKFLDGELSPLAPNISSPPTSVPTTPLPVNKEVATRKKMRRRKQFSADDALKAPDPKEDTPLSLTTSASPTRPNVAEGHLEEHDGYFSLFSPARAIVPCDCNNNGYLILTKENCFLMVDHEGRFQCAIGIQLPPYAQSLEIFEVVTWEEVAVFTTFLKRHTGRLQRAIYRFGISAAMSQRQVIEPSYYLTSDDRSDFYGIAITTHCPRLITTCRDDLAAYEWLPLCNGDSARKPQLLHRCYIGPSPRIFGTCNISADTFHVICSVGGSLNELFTIKYEKGASPLSRSWRVVDSNGPLGHLKNIVRGKLSLVDTVAFVLVENRIYRYENFPADPSLRCIYTFKPLREYGDQDGWAIAAQRINVNQHECDFYMIALMFPIGVKLFRATLQN